MTITSVDDFKAERNIPQISNPGVRAKLQDFIDKYEPKYLKALLGNTLAAEFTTGLIPVQVTPPTDPPTYLPIDAKWLFIRDNTELKNMLVDYIYYWYIRNDVTFTAGTGETKSANENSTRVSSADKQASAWNEAAKLAREFDLDKSIYPDYVRPVFYNYDLVTLYTMGWFYDYQLRYRINDIYVPISTSNL